MKSMWIMIAGPYHHGTDNRQEWESNHKKLNQAALAVFQKGHIPVIGVNLALPIIEVAGPKNYDNLMMPISLALAEKCDAVLRIGGASAGADREVEVFVNKNLPIYYNINEIPENND